MTPSSNWVSNERSRTLLTERSWLQGAILSAAAYGVVFSLSFMSVYELLYSPNRLELKKRLPLFVYIAVSFLLSTLFMISNAAFTQMVFIDDRSVPGGPGVFENAIPIDDLGSVSFVLSSWWSDMLVMWRFKVIYQGCRAPTWLIMLFPCLMLACSVGLGIGLVIQVSATNPLAANGVNFVVPYFSVSLSLNIILTIAIVLRLLSFQYRIGTVLGPTHGQRYMSVAAMMIESIALYSIIAITFLVLFSIRNPVSRVFVQSLSQFQTIAACLIMIRVARGRAWSEEAPTMTNGELEPMTFASPPAAHSAFEETEQDNMCRERPQAMRLSRLTFP